MSDYIEGIWLSSDLECKAFSCREGNDWYYIDYPFRGYHVTKSPVFSYTVKSETGYTKVAPQLIGRWNDK